MYQLCWHIQCGLRRFGNIQVSLAIPLTLLVLRTLRVLPRLVYEVSVELVHKEIITGGTLRTNVVGSEVRPASVRQCPSKLGYCSHSPCPSDSSRVTPMGWLFSCYRRSDLNRHVLADNRF